ncbi:hypothetical protein Pelo_15543 [Pelomyxa schiedti]|nr:hypothetical protein Pelo_15543 [Pelomyxa schiedti]
MQGMFDVNPTSRNNTHKPTIIRQRRRGTERHNCGRQRVGRDRDSGVPFESADEATKSYVRRVLFRDISTQQILPVWLRPVTTNGNATTAGEEDYGTLMIPLSGSFSPCSFSSSSVLYSKHIQPSLCQVEKTPVQYSTGQHTSSSSTPTDSATSSLDDVVGRVVSWAQSQQQENHLPKTAAKLENGIAKMCSAIVVLLITVGSDSTVSTFVPNPACTVTKQNFVGLLPHNSNSSATTTTNTANNNSTASAKMSRADLFSDDFMASFWKCVDWVKTAKFMPYKMEPLLKCLSQVCAIRHQVNPRDVVTELFKRGYISTNYSTTTTTTASSDTEPSLQLYSPGENIPNLLDYSP